MMGAVGAFFIVFCKLAVEAFLYGGSVGGRIVGIIFRFLFFAIFVSVVFITSSCPRYSNGLMTGLAALLGRQPTIELSRLTFFCS